MSQNSNQEIIPGITRDLVTALGELYPEQTPDPRWTEREIWMAVGRRQVVRRIASDFEDY